MGVTPIEFSLPIPDEFGVIEISGVRRMVVQQAIVDIGAFSLQTSRQYIVRTRQQVVIQALQQIFSNALMDFWLWHTAPNMTELQQAIETWFKTSEYTQTVPDSVIGINSLQDMVAVVEGAERDFSERNWRILDPSSTPASDKINQTYRIASGARVGRADMTPGEHELCETIRWNHITTCYSPRRTHLTRTAYEQAMDMVHDEPARVQPRRIDGPASDLSGIHALTAIMNYDHAFTGEDAIVVSKSFAERAVAYRRKKIIIFTRGEVFLTVKEGDNLTPGPEILQWVDVEGHKHVEIADQMRYPSIVEKIHKPEMVTHMGKAALRHRVDLVAETPIRSGDKLFTRAALKGVARVVPDDRMPQTEDGRVIDMIISPESVINRRAMTVYWEMMANAYVKDGGQVDPDHYDPKPTFEELVQLRYGKKQVLTKDGIPYLLPTYIGELYVVRVCKLAREAVSVASKKPFYTGLRTAVNQARVSGQKRDVAKGMALVARGMVETYKQLAKDNVTGWHAFTEIQKALQTT